jgi:hypothetical protein
MKRPDILTEAQVPGKFDDQFIRQLMMEAELPLEADLPHFKSGVHQAMIIGIRRINTPNDEEMSREIEALFEAADRRSFKTASRLVKAMSKRTMVFLSKRAKRIRLVIPGPDAFLDAASQEEACATLRSLVCTGVCPTLGRIRNDGTRAVKWMPRLYLPGRDRQEERELTVEQRKQIKKRRPPKRQGERDIVWWLGMAYLEATGDEPPMTAKLDNLGPFGRLVKACLERIGIKKPFAERRINELGEQLAEVAEERARRRAEQCHNCPN